MRGTGRSPQFWVPQNESTALGELHSPSVDHLRHGSKMTRRQSLTWFYLDWLGTILLVISSVTYLYLRTPAFLTGVSQTQPRILGREARAPIEAVFGMEVPITDRLQGDSRSDVVLLEFGDFDCAECRRFAMDVYPRVQREFIDTGRTAYDFHFLNAEGGLAVDAALCASEQRSFWPMRNAVFQDNSWASPAAISAHSRRLGLDERSLSSCLRRDPAARPRQADEAKRLRIDQGPTLLVGRRIHGTGVVAISRRINGEQPFDVIRTVVEEILRDYSVPARVPE